MKAGRELTIAGLAILCILHATYAQEKSVPQSVSPMSESQSLQLFSSLFGKRYAEVQRTPDPNDDAELAKLIVDSADQLKDNPVFQRFCYERAIVLAGDQPEAVDSAITATQRLVDLKTDPVKWSAKLVELYQLKYRTAAIGDRTPVAEKLVRAAKDAGRLLQSLRRSTEAITLYKLALPYARAAGSLGTEDIGNWISDARAQAQVDAQAAALEAKMASDPAAETAGQLIHLLIRNYDDAAGARKWLDSANDPQLTRRVNLLSQNPDKVSSADLLDLGLWWKSLASEVAGVRQRALLVHAQEAIQIAVDRKDLAGIDQIKANITLREINEAIGGFDKDEQSRPTNRETSSKYRLVIWNQHNGSQNDYGTSTMNIHLFYRDSEVATKTDVPIPWSVNNDDKISLDFPVSKIDRVRIEVTKWVKVGGGLAEVQVYKGGMLISEGKPTRASSFYDDRFTSDRITDGITTSSGQAKGYWLLRPGTAGWVDVYLSGQPPKP
ncbi:MAG: hypothetical protein ACYC26_03535 [Phycisphaerales bacterium]